MKDLKITWDNPTDSSGIDGNYIYRKAGDHTAIVDMAAFRTGADNVGSVGPGVAEFIDTDVPDGEYTYGVFSYNGSGSGPGDLSNDPFTVLTIVAPDSGPSLLRANYDIQTNAQFLQWKYSNGTINAPTWIANSNSFLIPGSAQGGYAIFSAGITSTMLYGGIKDVSYNPAGGQVPNIPIIDVTATDFSAVNGWTFGALSLWPKLPIPYFNAQLEITNFPISYDQYYPLYTTNQQAEDRLNLYGLPINVKQVNIDYPITDVTAASFYVPSTEALTMYLPELPLADGTSNYSDFSKRWDPDVAGGMPHDDASFPIVDQGMIFNGTHYNHDGTSR